MKRGKQFLLLGSVLAGLGVAIGAVGSHALKDFLLENNRTETFEIAVRYQLYHGQALIILGILCCVLKEINFTLVGVLWSCGTVGFSGSLYWLSLAETKWIVFVTPLGGLLMIGGWLTLFVILVKSPK